jgi:predicted nucleic acid-binding protein
MQTLEHRQVVPSAEDILDLVAESGCTSYDCEFIALAMQLGITLVTADKQLLKQFPNLALSLEDFTK